MVRKEYQGNQVAGPVFPRGQHVRRLQKYNKEYMFIISPGVAFDNRNHSSDERFLDVFVPPETRFRKMKKFQVSKPGS